MIPADVNKPVDPRKKEKHTVLKEEKRPLPVGVSDSRKASDEYYYIDKTLLIKEFLDERPMAFRLTVHVFKKFLCRHIQAFCCFRSGNKTVPNHFK